MCEKVQTKNLNHFFPPRRISLCETVKKKHFREKYSMWGVFLIDVWSEEKNSFPGQKLFSDVKQVKKNKINKSVCECFTGKKMSMCEIK